MSEVSDRLAAAPDAYRSRAFSSASLVTTGAAAIAAGAIFGGIARLPAAGAASAVVSMIFLLCSTIFFVAAGLYSRQTPKTTSAGTPLPQQIASIAHSIQLRMQIASFFALIAVVAFTGLIFVTALAARTTAIVIVRLKSTSATYSPDLCRIQGLVDGSISSSTLQDGSSPLAISVDYKRCGGGPRTVIISRSDIAFIEVKHG